MSKGPGTRRGVTHNPVTGQGDNRPGGIPGEAPDPRLNHALREMGESFDRPKLVALTRLLQLIFSIMPSTFVMFLDEWKPDGCPEARMIEWLKHLTPNQRCQIASACLEIAYRELGPEKFGQEAFLLNLRLGELRY